MSKLKDRVAHLVGFVGLLGHTESITVVGQVVNRNAEVLEELISSVESMAREIEELKDKVGE